MKRGCVLLCDADRLYLGRLHGYLKERIRMPLEWLDFTDVSFLPEHPVQAENTVLVIAQKQVEQAALAAYPAVLVLTEEDNAELSDNVIRAAKNTDIRTVSRYHRASVIADRLLEMLGDRAAFLQEGIGNAGGTRIVGYFSPLGRCMQTSAAIATGQMLAEKQRTLFIGFDAFPTSAFAAEDTGVDLADLLYYFGCDREKLAVWLQRAKRRLGALEYIPPASSIHRTAGVDGTEWIALIRAICAAEAPEYLLLDLSGQTQGLFDILSVCDEVYTITGHDSSDTAKVEAYKHFLIESGMEGLLKKTTFCRLPKTCKLPQRPEMLGGSTLAAHIVRNGLLPRRKKAVREQYEEERIAV